MKPIRFAAGLAAGLLTFSAHASNLGYTTLGVDLTRTRFDNDLVVGPASFSGTAGASVYGSYQFNENFFVMAGGTAESSTDVGFEIRSSSGYAGGGLALPVGGKTDVVLRLALVSVESEVCYNNAWWGACGTKDDSGYAAAAGVRHMATPNIEVNADYTHVELDTFDDSNTLSIGGAYWFRQHHSIRLTLGDTDDATTSAIGYRYTF